MTNLIFKGALFTGTLVVGVLTQTDFAHAASIVYDFTRFGEPLIDVAPTSFTSGGVTTTVSGNGVVTQTANGLGIARVDSVAPPEEVDGLALNGPDYIEFDFGDIAVDIASVTFGLVGTDVPIPGIGTVGNDDFSLSIDDNLVIENTDIPGGNGLDTGIGTFDFTSVLVPSGNVWRFTAPDLDDDFTIASLTIETEAIPTPALLPGLLGMGLATFRKRRNLTSQTEA